MTVPWRSWPVGQRVVVRFRRADGGAEDALGEIVSSNTSGADPGLAIHTRRGVVWVAADLILHGKPVPPPPARRRDTQTGQPPN